MTENVHDVYCDRLYKLFEKHHPGKYSRDYVNVIMEQNKDSEHSCYVTHCKSFDEIALPVVNAEYLEKKRKKEAKKKRKEEKRHKNKKKKKKKVKLEDLLSDDESDDTKSKRKKRNKEKNRKRVHLSPSLAVHRKDNEQRKSIIHMLRRGLIINNLAETASHTDASGDINTSREAHNIQVVVRFRPVNSKEQNIEHRLLFRTEFDMDDKDYDYFLVEREKLMQSMSIDELKLLTVDAICEWIQQINLDSYKKRFRRREVNGEWILEFPAFNEKKPLEYDENAVIVFGKANQSKKFEMDKILRPIMTQDDTFCELGLPVIDNIIAGYNCTIFAFGQTGTGKTHTMFGYMPSPPPGMEKEEKGDDAKSEDDDDYEITFSPEELTIDKKNYTIDPSSDGLIPRILNTLFLKLSSDDDIAFFTVQCGFIEIYQEKLRDLIRPRLKVQLRYVGMGSQLINLSWHDITNYNDMAKLIETSKSNRKTAATLQNDTSSRSHCIIQLKIELTLRDGTNQVNKISFGDLAGSEKLTKTGATGQRMNEAKKIVKSLFAIKKVIRALSEKKAFVPYQDSVLTKLLRDSLGGNSLTMIICTASPHAYNREETVSTLRFAEMAKKIENEAVVNRIVSRKEMEGQINNLREQLQYLRKRKASKRKRFTSTDFRVLQGQLIDASKRAEEYTQKYLQSEIQLLIKTQYIQELEQILNQKNIQIQKLKEKFISLKEGKVNVEDVDINEYDAAYDGYDGDEEEQQDIESVVD